MLDNIGFAIEELALSGSISLGRCSRSTVYRWAKEINRRLEAGHCDWRVKVNTKDMSIESIDKECEK